MTSIIITDCIILPIGSNGKAEYFKGSICIRDNRIVFAGDDPALISEFCNQAGNGLQRIDGSGKLAMPGLVNTHNHISMSLLRSYADDMALMQWLNDYIWPFESKLTVGDIELGAELGIAEMLLGGTTTTADMYWMEDSVARAVERLGIRAMLSPTFTDNRFEEFRQDFEAVAARYLGGQHPRITLAVAPHSAYTCCRETLLHAKELSRRHGIPLNIHIAETEDEIKIVREKYGCTPVEFLDQLGMLADNTIAVHMVHVTDTDIDILKKRKVQISHNPQSNMKLASGTAPVQKYIDAGLNVAIGTDGPSSNNDLDMWEEMRCASLLQKNHTGNPCSLPAYKVLEMATVGGACALGLGGSVGRIEPGYLADIILIDINKPHFFPQNDLIAHLVYCGKAADVDTVVVDGRIVVRDRKLLTADLPMIFENVRRAVADIISR